MAREALWTALADAADAVRTTVDQYRLAPTQQTRNASNVALLEYVKRLFPAIGQVEAFRYEASLLTYHDAIGRVEQLNATLSAWRFLDDGDRTLWQQLVEEQAAAGRAYEAAGVALDAALARARALDTEADETVMGVAGVTPRGAGDP